MMAEDQIVHILGTVGWARIGRSLSFHLVNSETGEHGTARCLYIVEAGIDREDPKHSLVFPAVSIQDAMKYAEEVVNGRVTEPKEFWL